jgi:hypothetical protein
MRINIFFIISLCFILGACSVNNKEHRNEIDNLEWLIGNWENISVESEFYEIWSKQNDTVFCGESYLLINKDTVFSEIMLLEQKGIDLLLTPTTNDQNDGNPITFKLISSLNGEFVFENKEHDFPQRIVYTNPKPDSIFAYIEGTKDGEYRKTDFSFKKVVK